LQSGSRESFWFLTGKVITDSGLFVSVPVRFEAAWKRQVESGEVSSGSWW
jgi:hypothetical protein